MTRGASTRCRDSENRAVVVHGFRSTFKSWALSNECERDMRQGGYYGGGLVGILNAKEYQERGMVAHGYTARQK